MTYFVPPTYRNTKRYARLVDGNVRNFRRQVSIVVRALCVGCYSYIFLQRFSHDLHQKTWYISATLLFLLKTFEVLKRLLKLRPTQNLGMKK